MCQLDKVRITLLVDAKSDKAVWSVVYEGPFRCSKVIKRERQTLLLMLTIAY